METTINGSRSFFIEVNGEPSDWTIGIHNVPINGIIFIADSSKGKIYLSFFFLGFSYFLFITFYISSK